MSRGARPTFEGRAMRIAGAMILGIIGAFLVVTGAVGGGTRMSYSGLAFATPLVRDPGPRLLLIIIGILLPTIGIYMLIRILPPSTMPGSEGITSIDEPSALGAGATGISSFVIVGLILLALILSSGGSPARSNSGSSTSSRPIAVVQDYIAAINKQNYNEAWAVGGKNSGLSNAKFIRSFSATAYDHLDILSVSGNVVNARLTAHQTSGSVKTYQGKYTTDNGIIDKFDIRQSG